VRNLKGVVGRTRHRSGTSRPSALTDIAINKKVGIVIVRACDAGGIATKISTTSANGRVYREMGSLPATQTDRARGIRTSDGLNQRGHSVIAEEKLSGERTLAGGERTAEILCFGTPWGKK